MSFSVIWSGARPPPSKSSSPVTWPIGMGKSFKGIYHFYEDRIYLYETGHGAHIHDFEIIDGLDNPLVRDKFGDFVRANWKELLKETTSYEEYLNSDVYVE